MTNSASESSNVQTIAALLQEEGYRAKIDLDSNTIRSATSGFRISIYIFKESIQIRLSLEGKGTNIRLEHVNEFNAKYRFAKLYLDEDGDILLEYDFLFDFSASRDKAAANLEFVMRVFDGSIGLLKDKLSALEEEVEVRLAQESLSPPPQERAAIEPGVDDNL